MNRLLATMQLDLRLQVRYKVYLIVIGAALAISAALSSALTPGQLQFFMPILILAGVSMTTVFLVGFLVLLERNEGTLDVVLVTPLRPNEYLASKLITLTSLALLESAIFAVVAYGLGFSAGWLILSVVMRGAMGVAVGVWVGVRYRSITRFLFPAIIASLAFDIPVLWYLELWPTPLFYLWPSMPPLLLAKAAFLGVDGFQIIYAVVYGLLIVGITLYGASQAIDRYVVRGEISE